MLSSPVVSRATGSSALSLRFVQGPISLPLPLPYLSLFHCYRCVTNLDTSTNDQPRSLVVFVDKEIGLLPYPVLFRSAQPTLKTCPALLSLRVYPKTCVVAVPAVVMACFSGHWVDFLSLYKLRTDLDRARVLFDCVLRREKVRRTKLITPHEDGSSSSPSDRHNEDLL